MFTQELLRTELDRRVRAASRGLDGDVLGSSPPGPVSGDDENVTAFAVVREFSPAAFARASLAFAVGVDRAWADAWFRSFTRTAFLAGNPANLSDRFHFAQVANDGSCAWLDPRSDQSGLQRLLRAFDGVAEAWPPANLTVSVPGERLDGTCPERHLLHVSTAGLTTIRYLVHLNHVLAEAVLAGLLAPGDRVDIRHVPRLGPDAVPYRMLRVHQDTGPGDRLRAWAALTTPQSE